MSKASKGKRHIHMYRLVPLGRIKVWACGISDCSHYMPPHMEALVEGKASECWDCAHQTIMSADRMHFAIVENQGKILCQKCMDKRKGVFVPSEDEIDELPDMDDIIASMRTFGREK